MKIIKLSDINVSPAYHNTKPKDYKIKECRDFWNRFQAQDRYIVLSSNNVLVDGYVQYIVLEECGAEEAEVVYINRRKNNHYRNSETTYVYGKHCNSKGDMNSKEYVWRVPESWKGTKEIVPKSKLLVRTKYGISPVIVTKIETWNECPVEFPVKKIYKII